MLLVLFVLRLHFLLFVRRGMFDKDTIGKMKKGAFLVNNARGAIVDREAVVEACKSGQLGGDFSIHLFLLKCSFTQS